MKRPLPFPLAADEPCRGSSAHNQTRDRKERRAQLEGPYAGAPQRASKRWSIAPATLPIELEGLAQRPPDGEGHAGPMRHAQGFEQVPSELTRRIHRQRAVLRKVTLDGVAAEIVHHVEVQAVTLIDVMNGDDVGMV